jgi:hypothetical protein
MFKIKKIPSIVQPLKVVLNSNGIIGTHITNEVKLCYKRRGLLL